MRRAQTLAVMTTVALLALAWPAAVQAWSWPASGAVLRPFAFGSDPYAGGQHRGVDIGADLGEGVRAPAAGTVTFAGTVPRHGKTVTITTADGYAVTLTHLGEVSSRKGDTVAEGATVGVAGASGEPEVPQPYVHLGVRLATDEHGYLDPLRFLPPRAAPTPPGGSAGEAPSAATAVPAPPPAATPPATATATPASAPPPTTETPPTAAPTVGTAARRSACRRRIGNGAVSFGRALTRHRGHAGDTARSGSGRHSRWLR